MSGYKIIDKPSAIPVPGNKSIQEFIGRVNTGDTNYSVARMVAPPGWDEPAQTPRFDEITIMLKGAMKVVVQDEEQTLHAGEVLIVEKGTKVQYSNPFEEESEYWALCLPAFSPELANRES